MKKTIFAFIIFLVASSASARFFNPEAFSKSYAEVRAGWSIGGTMPMGLPASIRALNSYTLQPNFQVAFDLGWQLKPWLAIEAGIGLENKAMSIDARVKSYDMVLSQEGSDPIAGVFTGNVISDASAWQICIAPRAAFWVRENVKLFVGPYIAPAISKSFKGYAYNGYIRQGDPTGARTDVGDTEQTRGNYDFSDDLRTISVGANFGVNWYVYKRLGVFADVTWAFNGAFKSSFTTIKQTMYPVYGTIGITYKLK